MKIVFIDTETTGLDPERHSLLSFAATLWSNEEPGEWMAPQFTVDFQVEDEVVWSKAAYAVNGINPYAYGREEALTIDRALTRICDTFFYSWNLTDPLIFGGHNVAFDLSFLRATAGKNKSGYLPSFFNKHIRAVDTVTCARLLQAWGELDENISCSLDSIMRDLMKRAGSEWRSEGTAHAALDDALASKCIWDKCYTKLNKGAKCV